MRAIVHIETPYSRYGTESMRCTTCTGAIMYHERDCEFEGEVCGSIYKCAHCGATQFVGNEAYNRRLEEEEAEHQRLMDEAYREIEKPAGYRSGRFGHKREL